jgi:beta-xylosidase
MGCASGGGSTYVWTASGTKAGTNNGEVSSWNWVSKGTLPRCYYDQGLLIDTDDTMYVAYGSTTLNIAQLSSDGLSEVKTQAVYKPSDNLYLEGSRLYKINGWYYIWTTKPANEQYVLRSKSVWGPYERQLLLSNIKGPLSSAGVAHQGGVVDTKDGKYYYVAFLDSYPAGRIPVVAPITFVNDWPVITKVNGEWGKTYPVPVVTSKTVPKSTGLDSFTGSALGPEWEWNHNPDTSKFSLLGGSGGLSLKAATVTSDLFNARNTLTRRIIGPKSSATFRMDLSKLADGDRAGAVLFRDVAAYIGVHKSGSTAQIVMANNLNLGTNWVTTSTGSVAATGPALASGATDVWFRIQADITPAFGTNTARQTTFWYSTDGSKFTQLGGGFSMSNAWEFFTGYRFGVFNFATKALGGSAVVKSCDVQMV